MTAFVFRHRLLSGLLWLAVLVWGLFAYHSIPRREDPDVPVRFGQVVALWPGADTQQVENLLADRLERTLLALDDVQKVETRCRPGLAILKVQARDATPDLAVFWSQVRDRLTDARPGLPDGVLPLQVNDHFGDTSILIYGVVWPRASERQREDLARRVRDNLRCLAPLAEVSLIGQQAERIEVRLDSLQLSRYRINPSTIADRLSRTNLLPQSGGMGESQSQRWLTQSTRPMDVESLRALPIQDRLSLSDLASIERVLPDPALYRVRVDGQPAVAISVTMRKGEDILATGRRVEAEVEKLRAGLPPGCQLVKVNDLPHSVIGRIAEFNHNLRDGVMLILLVTFAFMGWRSAALVGVMLPLTILGTYAAMQACGRDLQQMSITALIIALGLVVDNSVVVVDNIEHQLSQGLAPEQAARSGADGIRLPLLTSNLTTVAAFLPLAGLPGGKGDFIRDLGLVTSLSTLVSLALNLTLLPFLCRYFLRPLQGETRRLDWLRNLMTRAAQRALRHPGRTVALASALSLGALAVMPLLGVQFFPSAQRSQCLVEVWTRDGSSLESTGQSVALVEKWLAQQPEVVNHIAYLGGGGPRFYYNVDPETALSNYAQIVVNTRGVAQTEKLVARLRELSRSGFPAARVVPRKLEQGPPVGAPLALRLQAEDGESLRSVADGLVELLKKQPGVWLAYHDMGELAPQLNLDWDEQRLIEVGLSPQDVAQATRIALNGLPIAQLRLGDRELPVDLRSRAPLEELNLFGAGGQVLPLSALAQPRVQPGVWRHSRYNRRPTCNVYGFTDESRLPSKILAECLPQAQALVPASMSLSYGGEQEEVDKSLRELAIVFASAVLGQLLIVAWEFNRLSLAVSVLAAVPLSLFGGILGLALTGNAFSFTAFLGLITLGGVVTNHAIMFFEYTLAEAGQAQDLTSAMIRAGSLRMRPILLTILLSIGGLLPLAIGGGNLWPPMAWTLIFGLLYSLPLALVVVPSFYAWISRWRPTRPRWLPVLFWLLVAGTAQASPGHWPRCVSGCWNASLCSTRNWLATVRRKPVFKKWPPPAAPGWGCSPASPTSTPPCSSVLPASRSTAAWPTTGAAGPFWSSSWPTSAAPAGASPPLRKHAPPCARTIEAPGSAAGKKPPCAFTSWPNARPSWKSPAAPCASTSRAWMTPAVANRPEPLPVSKDCAPKATTRRPDWKKWKPARPSAWPAPACRPCWSPPAHRKFTSSPWKSSRPWNWPKPKGRPSRGDPNCSRCNNKLAPPNPVLTRRRRSCIPTWPCASTTCIRTLPPSAPASPFRGA